MANLHVAIVVRTKTNGRRNWVVAKGKDDPPGIFYLRKCVGSTPQYTKAGESYDEAEVAKIRLERQLNDHA
jgi:hypothetical protein